MRSSDRGLGVRQLASKYMLWLLGCAFASAWAQTAQPPRVALVIANGHYADPRDALPGARRDGQKVGQALEQANFRVTRIENATKSQMETAVKAFQRAVRDAGPTALGFLYYAGHGSADAAKTDNYLLPVDIESIASPDIASRGLGVRWITDLLRAGDTRPAIAVVVDACRTTAGAASPTRGAVGAGAPGSGPDLIEPEELSDRGYLVAYSTSKGRVASDGGLFAEALAAKIKTPGLTLDQVFEQVRQDVGSRTTQLPTFRSTVVEKVCLAGCEGANGADPLAVLRAAVAERATGDAGQVAAIRQLFRDGRSLSGFDLAGLHLKGADLAGGDLSGAELLGVDLENAGLAGARLSQSRLAFATLNSARASGLHAREARLYFADGTRADFADADAERSNWHGAQLSGASFRRAKLSGASFMMADLRGADFRGADLRGAFFIGALLTGARFDEALVDNTDLTGAVGDAAQFTVAQRAALCATENRRAFTWRLVRETKSTRYDSGRAYSDLERASFPLARGLSLLQRCGQRSAVPAGRRTIWKAGAYEAIVEGLDIFLPAEILDRAGRERRYVERLRASAEALNAAYQGAAFVKVTGESHRRLLAALERNATKARLESPATLDGDAMTMYLLRSRPDAVEPSHWVQMAEQWAAREAAGIDSLRRNHGNHWPLFFPPGTSPSELAPEHVEVFKRWTLQRAREYPVRVTVQHRQLGQLRHLVLGARSDATGQTLQVWPLRAISLDHGAPTVAPALAASVGSAANLLPASSGGWGGGSAVIRLPRTVDEHGLTVSPRALEVAANESIGLRLTLAVRGLRTLRAGGDSVDVLDAEIVDMHLLDATGGEVR
jgi:uncharacterized protein YjbI with pentapeptide repeats